MPSRYIDKVRARVKGAGDELSGYWWTGKLMYGQLEEYLLAREPTLAMFEIRHMFRDMAVRSGGSDRYVVE